MKVLITGFEPFGKHRINPSQNLINAIPTDSVDNIQLFKHILPVDTDQTPKRLLHTMDEHSPDAVLSFGLAPGRQKITIERLAVNLMDFRIPDNNGKTISEQPIIKDGPAAYFSTLPVRGILDALQSAGIPADLSMSAGTYLCNQVFYTMMHHITTRKLPTLAGFIHLPAQPEQTTSMNSPIPCLDLEVDRKALTITLAYLKNHFGRK